MQGRHVEHVVRMSVAGLLTAGCPAHTVHSHPSDEDSSEDDDGDDAAGPEPTPTTAPVTTGMDSTSTGILGASSETGASGETETTTQLPPGTCGDGIVDEGETCDLGFAQNSDGGDCTQTCQTAFCGDSLVHEGTEACDAGAENNNTTYGGCREDCTLGARCMDGVVQPEEECDPSAPPSEGSVDCNPGNCKFEARVAFVTADSFDGDLGGLAGADALCRARAEAAGLDNASSFLAYLGDGEQAPASRFTDGAKAKNYPYTRRDGQKLADDLDDLFALGLQVPLAVTELGTTLPPEQYAWTGVHFDGSPSEGKVHCESWSTTYYKYSGQVGQISPVSDSEADLFTWRNDGHWVKYKTWPCKPKAPHFYCFED